MQRLFHTLFLIIASICCTLNSERVFAAELNKNSPNLFESHWSGDEEELYLNINISNELQFEGTYTTMKMKNGQGCEIAFTPLEGHNIISPKGHQLQKITLLAEVYNNPNNLNEVNFKITSKSFYKGTDNTGKAISVTEQLSRSGILKNPAIDLTQAPVFFTLAEELNTGVISFKNAFLYSSM